MTLSRASESVPVTSLASINFANQHTQETRLSTLRPVTEFFDIHRISRPADANQAISRITYNTRHFSGMSSLHDRVVINRTQSYPGNYLIIIGALAVYALLTNQTLLIALVFLIGGFTAINRFGEKYSNGSWSIMCLLHISTGCVPSG
jgi:PRA1 family protein 1